MIKKLDITGVTNELTGKSAFFKKDSSSENKPIQHTPKVKQAIKDTRSTERAFERSDFQNAMPIRVKKRHSFEFYADQIEKLVLIRNQSAKTLSMSKIVRDAIDEYFDKKSLS